MHFGQRLRGEPTEMGAPHSEQSWLSRFMLVPEEKRP
jgi:hypothetical protein